MELSGGGWGHSRKGSGCHTRALSPGTTRVLGEAMKAGAWAERQWCLEDGDTGGRPQIRPTARWNHGTACEMWLLVLDQRPEFQRCCKRWRQWGQDILSECWVWQAHPRWGWEGVGSGLAFLKEGVAGANVGESLERGEYGEEGGPHREPSRLSSQAERFYGVQCTGPPIHSTAAIPASLLLPGSG